MEKVSGAERKNLDFTESVSEIIHSARRLASGARNTSDFVRLDINEGEHLIITFTDVDETRNKLRKIYQQLNLIPQKVRRIKLFYNPLELDNGELVAPSLKFTQEEWKDRKTTKLVEAHTTLSEAWANLPRRKPQEGIYPIYDRDTIDWSRMPQQKPIGEEVAVKILAKIQEQISSLSS